jgi:hypothetical protein
LAILFRPLGLLAGKILLKYLTFQYL